MDVQRTGRAGAALSAGSPNIKTVLAELFPQAVNDGAAIAALSNRSFAQKVENHISDYRRGQGYLSSDVGDQIFSKGENLAGLLDPKSSRNYTAYTTGLRYDLKARFVNNLSDSLSRIKGLFA